MREYKEKLLNLQKAFKELEELAYTSDLDFNKVVDLSTYPFEESFDEIQFKVDNWVNNTIEKMEIEEESEG